MKLTNNYGLPDEIANSIRALQKEPVDGELHVTELIDPPQLVALKRKHWDDLEEDVASQLFAFMGSMAHRVLQDAEHEPGALIEYNLQVPMPSEYWRTLSGTPDKIHNGKLTDYKMTSVWSFMLGDKPEWEAQLNIYRWMAAQEDIVVDELEIIALLRDHRKGEMRSNRDYPPVQMFVKPIPVWDLNDTHQFIIDALLAHESAAKGEPHECSAMQRWAKPDRWAIKKLGNKRAIPGGLFENETEAKEMIEALRNQNSKQRYELEYRRGVSTRCEEYCPVATYCAQAKKMGIIV